jgi:hypothetical protein
MPFRTRTAARLVRTAVLAVLAALLLPGSAFGAGTGGVDVSPYPGVVNGKQVTAFHAKVPSRGSSTVEYALRNTTGKPATARLFAAKALLGSKGSFTIGPAGSSPYVAFKDRQVTLAPHETRIASFRITPGPGGRPKGTVYGALVVEVKNGAIIQQAATVIYLEPGRLVPLPVLFVIIAITLLVLLGLALLVARRKRQLFV